jgi:TP901 family phage tail tape measure protein
MGIKNGGIDISDAVKGGDILANKLDEPINKIDKLTESLEKLDKEKSNIKPKVDTSGLKKLEGIKDIEVLVTPTLSKNAEKTIKDGIQKIVHSVNKDFTRNKPPKANWNTIEKYVPELDNSGKRTVKTYVTNYEKRIGKTLSEVERTELTDRYTKIKRIEKAITQLESEFTQRTGSFPNISSMNPDAIKKYRDSAQLYYSLIKTLNEINKDDGKQLRSDVIKKINKVDPKSQYDKIRQGLIQSIYDGSGIHKYINSVNEGKEFSSTQFEKYTKKLDEGIAALEYSYSDNAKEALKNQNEYNKMFGKMSRFRTQKPEQARKNVNKILKDYQGKTREAKDLEIALDELETPTKIMNFLGDYAVYKKHGNKPNDIIENYIQGLSKEYELAKSTISDVLFMTDEQFSKKLAEIQAPKVDTKPLQEEAKAIVDANNQEAESEKKLDETKQEVAKQKKKTETANSKKKKQEEKPKVTDKQKSEEKPVSNTPSTPISHKPSQSPDAPDASNQTPALPQTNTEESNEQLENESKAFEKVEKAAGKAATAKENFNSANQMVAAGAEKSSQAIEKERKEMKAVTEDAIPAKGDSDKLITIKDSDGNIRSHTQVKTEKDQNAYITTSTTYSPTDEGTLEVSSERIVEDMKRLKTEAEKESVKVQKANEKLDKFLANIDLQMGGKINAMQLDGYMGLKHIFSVDEIDGLAQSMERVEAEKKKIFSSSKTNQKDLFGVNNLQSTVSSVVSAFNALNDPSDELSESVGRMLDLNEELKDASGIYEQAEAAGKLRDSISECNTQIKQQQNLEKDNKRISDSNKKNALLDEKKKAKEQELNDLEQRLKDSFKYSDQVASQIENLRNILSGASTNLDLSIFDAKFKSLNKSEQSLPIVTESFKSNWDKWLSIIDKNNASENFGNINLPTESTSAFNNVDAIYEYITNKVKQAINLSKNISKLQNDLSKEISKSSDQQNSQIIEDLNKNIKSDKKSLDSIISNDLFKDKDKFISKDIANAYRDAELNLRKSTDNLKNTKDNQEVKKPIIDQYDKALAKVKELEKAQNELFSLQGKQANNPFADYTSEIENAKNKVSALKSEVDTFYKSDFLSKNKSILGPDKVDKYNESYTKAIENSKNNNDNLVEAMKKSYTAMRDSENKILQMSGKNNSQFLSGDIDKQIYAMEVVRASYESLKKEVNNIYGQDFQQNAIGNIQSIFDSKTTDSLASNNQKITNQLETFASKIKETGSISAQAKNDIASVQEEINKLTRDYNGDASTYSQKFIEASQKASNTMAFWKDGFGGKALNIEEQISNLNKLANSSDKVASYTTKINSFAEAFNGILSNDTTDTDEKIKQLDELSDKIKEFSKNAKAYDKTNSKGTLISGSEGITKDISDVIAGVKQYAELNSLGKEVSSKVNENAGTATIQFQNEAGAITTVTGTLQTYNNALRITSTEQSKANASFKTFGSALRSIAGGSLKDIMQMVTSYVSSYRIISTMINQLQQGFSTLKAYDDNLTTISYTMDITKEQLNSLGQSAIDMAQDLSMSLENAMDIYQIYANMNTTAEEINETAKPTAILSNLSGVDTSTAADQVQGILQQFNMLEDGSQSAADASMHVVDVLDKISSNVAIDYARGIKVISDAVQASGQVAYDAGMSYEQLAAVSAKVAERTREDGGSIGNAIKTIVTRISKVGKMPQYASDVSNEELSNASKSLHEVGIEVYNVDGSFRDLDVILSELSAKWDTLSDAQQSNISYNVAA